MQSLFLHSCKQLRTNYIPVTYLHLNLKGPNKQLHLFGNIFFNETYYFNNTSGETPTEYF